jgi:N-acetylglucosamine malate deacetylase 1
MKPSPTSPTEMAPVLAFGAHPDDIEFGCGGVIVKETRAGRTAHLVVCSRGECATHGILEERTAEAEEGARILGASLRFLDLDGDSHLEIRTAHTLALAAIIRETQPGIVLAPSLVENQHPDHSRLGRLVRDAARLARYGGVGELSRWQPHSIRALLFYAGSLESEPRDIPPVLVDVSDSEALTAWTAAMQAHGSQTAARRYVELQLTRARLHGLSAGVEHAIALFPNDPVVVDSLAPLSRSARAF